MASRLRVSMVAILATYCCVVCMGNTSVAAVRAYLYGHPVSEPYSVELTAQNTVEINGIQVFPPLKRPPRIATNSGAAPRATESRERVIDWVAQTDLNGVSKSDILRLLREIDSEVADCSVQMSRDGTVAGVLIEWTDGFNSEVMVGGEGHEHGMHGTSTSHSDRITEAKAKKDHFDKTLSKGYCILVSSRMFVAIAVDDDGVVLNDLQHEIEKVSRMSESDYKKAKPSLQYLNRWSLARDYFDRVPLEGLVREGEE